MDKGGLWVKLKGDVGRWEETFNWACSLAEEKEMKEVYEAGVVPESEGKVVPYLFVEADGTNIALQREEAKRAEVKVGIAYEG